MPHANTFEGRGCEGKGHDFYPPTFFIEGRGFFVAGEEQQRKFYEEDQFICHGHKSH